MLDFIVLGMVPGTNFVITFEWSLIFATIFCVGILFSIEAYKLKNKTHSKNGVYRQTVNLKA